MTLKLRKCPACVFVDELAPAMLPEQFCEQHVGMSLPLGPDGQIVIPERRVDVRCEHRWHEIATEGLPPENEQVLVWTYDSVRVARRDDIGWLGEEDQVVSKVTHWHPLPAPPTKAPR